jgi:RNA polymerase sigma-70 factor (ECF subfamily)
VPRCAVRILLVASDVISAAQVEEALVPDNVLAERARIGSPSAFAELVERHREAVYTIVRNLCRTVADTEENLHEVFLTAWRNLRSFPAGARFTTWLYSIATRTALAYRMRRYRGQRTSNQLDAFLPAFAGKGALIAGDSRRPEVEVRPAERIDITAALRGALESIDDLTRAAFVLCDVLELRPEEAAVILEMSPRSARQHAHQARLLLPGLIDRL